MKFLENKFTLLRILAASMVILGHAYDLQDQADFAKRLTGASFGAIGVFIFFGMSGYLISSSAQRRPDIGAFLWARLLRIVPGLWAMLFATTGLMAFLYPIDPTQMLKYVVCNGSIFYSCYDLNPVFHGNPSEAINGSLWTLKFEGLCYVGVAVMIVFRLLRSRVFFFFVAFSFVIFLFIPYPHPQLVHLHQLGGCFMLGMFAAAIRPASPAPKPDLTPDISYGLYIYAFPIQQAIISTFGFLPPAAHAAFAFFLTLVPATISWFLVERPALSLKAIYRNGSKRNSVAPKCG